MTTRVLLDISRLLVDAGRPTPTGILRVELTYAEHWLATKPDQVNFAAKNLLGRLGPITDRQASRLTGDIAKLWSGERVSRVACWQLRLRAFSIHVMLLWRGERSLYRMLARRGDPVAYVIVSHAHLESPGLVRRLKAKTGARFVYFVHDLIPWQYPEFDTPGWATRVERRARAAAELADGLVVNSEDTRATFLRMLQPTPPSRFVVAPLGVRLPSVVAPPKSNDDPYFVVIGTIEPKKNHLFLLNLWRQMRVQLGDATPRLVLIGKRGWENENVIDMLDRSTALKGFVEERGRLPDTAAMELLMGARALLQPSFAEGYGLPLAEALTLGTPAICSDIPALREIGRDVPEFIDPLDGPSWRRTILDYMADESPRRRAQLERLKGWRPPAWDRHFERVDTLIDHDIWFSRTDRDGALSATRPRVVTEGVGGG